MAMVFQVLTPFAVAHPAYALTGFAIWVIFTRNTNLRSKR